MATRRDQHFQSNKYCVKSEVVSKQGNTGVISNRNEPPRDKTNKVSVRQAKNQIRLGIRPVWSESSLSAWRKLGPLATHWAQAKTLIRLGGCPG